MIGKDNRARAAERKQSYKLFREAILFREREIERNEVEEYEAALYSQLWLRASELIKKVLQLQRKHAMTPIITKLDEMHSYAPIQVRKEVANWIKNIHARAESLAQIRSSRIRRKPDRK